MNPRDVEEPTHKEPYKPLARSQFCTERLERDTIHVAKKFYVTEGAFMRKKRISVLAGAIIVLSLMGTQSSYATSGNIAQAPSAISGTPLKAANGFAGWWSVISSDWPVPSNWTCSKASTGYSVHIAQRACTIRWQNHVQSATIVRNTGPNRVYIFTNNRTETSSYSQLSNTNCNTAYLNGYGRAICYTPVQYTWGAVTTHSQTWFGYRSNDVRPGSFSSSFLSGYSPWI